VGYGLHIEGFETFRSLAENKSKLTPRPYCSYCFVLIQETDLVGIETYWTLLRDAARAMGSAVALMVLVESARLPGYCSWESEHGKPIDAMLQRYELGKPPIGHQHKVFDRYTIFESVGQRKVVGNEQWRGEWTVSGGACVELARAFGVGLSEFPCLLIVDHESVAYQKSSSPNKLLLDYTILPLEPDTGSQLGLIREVSDAFYRKHGDTNVVQAMSTISRWPRGSVPLTKDLRHTERKLELVGHEVRARIRFEHAITPTDLRLWRQMIDLVERAAALRSQFPLSLADDDPIGVLEEFNRSFVELVETSSACDPQLAVDYAAHELLRKADFAVSANDVSYLRILSGHVLKVSKRRRREIMAKHQDRMGAESAKYLDQLDNEQTLSDLKGELAQLDELVARQRADLMSITAELEEATALVSRVNGPPLSPVAMEVLKRRSGRRPLRARKGVAAVARATLQSVIGGVLGGMAG